MDTHTPRDTPRPITRYTHRQTYFQTHRETHRNSDGHRDTQTHSASPLSKSFLDKIYIVSGLSSSPLPLMNVYEALLYARICSRWQKVGLIKESSGRGLPWWLSGKESTCQCRGHEFDPRFRGGSHMQLSPCATTIEPMLQSQENCNY